MAKIRVTDSSAQAALSWDRFVRLKATAEALEKRLSLGSIGLDVGGYDGALALFLEGMEIDLLDPATTGGSATAIEVEDQAYDFVAAVDVLEHVEPEQRQLVLKECARIARQYLVLNYPCRESRAAQELMLRLTGNSLIRQHVEWQLPDSDWVTQELKALGFACEVKPHSSTAIWVGQYLAQNLMPEAAKELNRYLIEHHSKESFDTPLYHLVIATASRIGNLDFAAGADTA